jgi:hypothetical protein
VSTSITVYPAALGTTVVLEDETVIDADGGYEPANRTATIPLI